MIPAMHRVAVLALARRSCRSTSRSAVFSCRERPLRRSRSAAPSRPVPPRRGFPLAGRRMGSRRSAQADTVVVPGFDADDGGPVDGRVLDALRAARRAARDRLDLHGRVRARRRGPARRPARDDALAHADQSAAMFPRRRSTPTCSTSTRATCSPRPASPPASTSACTCCAATTAPRRPTPPRAGRSSRRTARADRRSSSSAGANATTAGWRRRAPGRSSASSEPLTVAQLAAPRALQRAHVHPPLPRRDRHDAAALAACPAVDHARRLLERSELPSRGRAALRLRLRGDLRQHFRRVTATTRPPIAAPSPARFHAPSPPV